MPDVALRPRIPAVITLVVFCLVIIAASTIRSAGESDGRLGLVFFLLTMVAPLFIAAGVAVALWRLLAILCASHIAVPERMLFTFASFVIVCGSGPLLISLAVMEITRREGSIGAAGIWALTSIVVGLCLCVFGLAVTLGRLALQRLPSKQS